MTASFTAIGGLNHPEGRMGLTGPLVRLEATPNEIQLSARFGLGKFLGPWLIPRAQVTKIRPASTSLGFFTGVEIIVDASRVWIFWSLRHVEVLAGLRTLGYPVRDTY